MQTGLRRVFVHGSGRAGSAAWPMRSTGDGEFLALSPGSTIAAQSQRMIESGADAVVFAHSIGAVPTAIAARACSPRGVVLVEPALYDIARGEHAIERHIAIVTEARSQAEVGDLRAFWTILRPLMFGGPFDAEVWEQERPVAERWATTNLPWGHGVRADMLDGVPTLVVTGGWNAEYELIAAALAARGARHEVLQGAQHRPQDLPGFRGVVEQFEHSLRPR
ncbi:hypothetical protein ACWGJP_12555 [Microbacterium sp. NPDC055903]